MAGTELVEVHDPAVLRDVFRLRALVWSREPGVTPETFPAGEWRDAHDSHAWHWAVFEGSRVVAAARLCIHSDIAGVPHAEVYAHVGQVPGPVASINRLVVHPDCRGRGFSAQLDRARIATARAEGCRTVVVFTKDDRLPALRALGFTQHGPIADYRSIHALGTHVVSTLSCTT